MSESEFSGESVLIEVEDDFYSSFSFEELSIMLHDALIKNKKNIFEIRMFERYLKESEKKLELTESIQEDTVTKQSRKRSKSRTSSRRACKLTNKQKCNIASTEVDEHHQEIEKTKIESEKIIDNLQALIEEANIRLAELHKLRFEFDRDVVKGGQNPTSKIVMSEKLIRHFDERLRQRDTLIDKLRLKNSSLKQHKNNLKMQLKQKEELGETLGEVDFKQLKIENEQYLEKIDEKNKELGVLKCVAGMANKVLNSYKKKLKLTMDDVKKIKSDIYTRQDMCKKNRNEITQVLDEKDKAESINCKLLHLRNDFKVPEVTKYVSCVAEQYELNKKEKEFIRKIEISKMALNRHKKIWSQTRINFNSST